VKTLIRSTLTLLLLLSLVPRLYAPPAAVTAATNVILTSPGLTFGTTTRLISAPEIAMEIGGGSLNPDSLYKTYFPAVPRFSPLVIERPLAGADNTWRFRWQSMTRTSYDRMDITIKYKNSSGADVLVMTCYDTLPSSYSITVGSDGSVMERLSLVVGRMSMAPPTP
jgi:hypothetical protein